MVLWVVFVMLAAWALISWADVTIRSRGWQRVYRCQKCGHIVDQHWSYLDPCRECGHANGADNKFIVARTMWTGKFHKPHTWPNMRWEIKDE